MHFIFPKSVVSEKLEKTRCVETTRMAPSKKLKICNFNNTCGHKLDGCLTYKKSAQNLKAYRNKVCITVVFKVLNY